MTRYYVIECNAFDKEVNLIGITWSKTAAIGLADTRTQLLKNKSEWYKVINHYEFKKLLNDNLIFA